MNGHGIEQDMSAAEEYDVEMGAWLEATYDPDSPRYDTLDEQDGHA